MQGRIFSNFYLVCFQVPCSVDNDKDNDAMEANDSCDKPQYLPLPSKRKWVDKELKDEWVKVRDILSEFKSMAFSIRDASEMAKLHVALSEVLEQFKKNPKTLCFKKSHTAKLSNAITKKYKSRPNSQHGIQKHPCSSRHNEVVMKTTENVDVPADVCIDNKTFQIISVAFKSNHAHPDGVNERNTTESVNVPVDVSCDKNALPDSQYGVQKPPCSSRHEVVGVMKTTENVNAPINVSSDNENLPDSQYGIQKFPCSSRHEEVVSVMKTRENVCVPVDEFSENRNFPDSQYGIQKFPCSSRHKEDVSVMKTAENVNVPVDVSSDNRNLPDSQYDIQKFPYSSRHKDVIVMKTAENVNVPVYVSSDNRNLPDSQYGIQKFPCSSRHSEIASLKKTVENVDVPANVFSDTRDRMSNKESLSQNVM